MPGYEQEARRRSAMELPQPAPPPLSLTSPDPQNSTELNTYLALVLAVSCKVHRLPPTPWRLL